MPCLVSSHLTDFSLFLPLITCSLAFSSDLLVFVQLSHGCLFFAFTWYMAAWPWIVTLVSRSLVIGPAYVAACPWLVSLCLSAIGHLWPLVREWLVSCLFVIGRTWLLVGDWLVSPCLRLLVRDRLSVIGHLWPLVRDWLVFSCPRTDDCLIRFFLIRDCPYKAAGP